MSKLLVDRDSPLQAVITYAPSTNGKWHAQAVWWFRKAWLVKQRCFAGNNLAVTSENGSTPMETLEFNCKKVQIKVQEGNIDLRRFVDDVKNQKLVTV